MGGKSSKGGKPGEAKPDKAAQKKDKPAKPAAPPKKDNKKAEPKKPELKEPTEKEMDMLLKSTHFTKEQIIAIHKDFAKECPNGKLNKKDFVKLFKTLHPLDSKKAKADNYCDYVFKAFDRDNNGIIDFQEFVVAFSISSFGDLKEKAEFAFHVFDLKKDKKIDKNEMIKVIESLYDLSGIPAANRKGDNAPKARAEKLMLQMDLDKDKVLNTQEFVNGVLDNEAIREFLLDPIFNKN